MKHQQNTLFTAIRQDDHFLLTMPVHEVIASQQLLKDHKPFSATDLWKIQRKKKKVEIRKYAW